ncbi:MAG TPA: PAS domain S-box protein [Methanobacterium subterraneum]|uniref:histidine kinase n=1 Tax=Methanobacterium subterraneum TaxID=59277 RepID=A0A7J4TLH5_9EURY|nr:PAS domain S-box protein [Methanobacterium subterraneum]
MKVKSDYHIFKEIFEKSPVGMLLFDREGIMVYANQSSLEIMGITTSENPPEINLFHNPIIPLKKEQLREVDGKGVINFKNQLDLEKIYDFYDTSHPHPINIEGVEIKSIEGTISVTSSGYLIQIQQSGSKEESEELILSEERYKRFFEDDLTGDFIATPQGEIIECNPAFAEIYNFPNREQALQSNISTFNPDDWENLIKRLKHEYRIQGHQTTHQRPDGKKIHVVSNLVGICNDLDELVQVKGYVFDDTERKEADEALKRSEEKYHRLFDEDLTGDFIAGVDGEIVECNPAFAEIYGFENVKDVVGSDISHFNPSDWNKLITRLNSEIKIQDYQSWQKISNEKHTHVVASLVGIFSDSGELIQVKGYVFDDTERKLTDEALKRSEEKYHRLFDEDLTGDFIAGVDGEIVECNPAFAEIYGFDNVEKALQWNISESNPFDWPYMVTRLRSEGKIKGFQSWQRRQDFMRIHVVANLVGIFNDFGELIQVKGYVFDDTERKQAEEKLESEQRRINRILDSIQDGFVALDNLWNFIYVNPCAAEDLDFDVDDLLGENLWERFPELAGTTHETHFRKAMNEQEIQYFEAQGILKTGQCLDVSVYPSTEGISIYWRNKIKSSL